MRTFLLVLPAFVVLTGAALAQSAPRSDGDGVVTRQDYDARRDAMFDRLDANHDAYLAGDEFGPRGRHGRGRHGPYGGEQGMEHRLDANNDGAITRDEFLARPLQAFARLDRNSDGVASADEMQAARAARHEAREHRREAWRDRADANHDGRVSREEFRQAGSARFDSADANHDGRLTAEERAAIRAARERR